LCRRGARPRFGTGLVLRMWGRLWGISPCV
jgi:hypothetical protein